MAELIQNVIDAIRKGMRKGNLHIMLDKRSGTIRVQENGIGMSPKEMSKQLQAFSSDKKDDEELVGEQGVGIDYVILETELFEAISGTDQGVTRVIVKNTHTWVRDKTNNEDLEWRLRILQLTTLRFVGQLLKPQAFRTATYLICHLNNLKQSSVQKQQLVVQR
ncbi:ATP-binding protein [Priestia megaterium]